MTHPARNTRTQLFLNGHIYSQGSATAIAISQGVVSWVGSDAVGRALHPDADVVDLDGRFVAPGFVDAHIHTTATGLALSGLDLSSATSKDHALALIREFSTNQPADTIIYGSGWDEAQWMSPAPLTTADLDTAAPERRIYLTRVDVHSAAVSTALRVQCPNLADQPGFDEQRPLVAAAHHQVRQTWERLLSPSQRIAAQQAALDNCASHGIVSIHENAGPEISGIADAQTLAQLDHGVHRRILWGQLAQSPDHAHHLLEVTGADALAGDLFIDGSLGSHTALISAPYSDLDHAHPHRSGIQYLSDDEVYTHIVSCTKAGIQCGFHVIGDTAIAVAVDALKRVAAEQTGPKLAACGHRLEHVEMASTEHAAVLAQWGVTANLQPLFDAKWGGDNHLYSRRLGDRHRSMNNFAMLAAAGVPLVISSDSPVTPSVPWEWIRAAAHHHTPGHSISPRAAFTAATRGAWRAGGVRDGIAGTLVPGAPATFAVWEADELVVQAPKDSVQRWSIDPRSGVPALPSVEPGAKLPECVHTVRDGNVIFTKGLTDVTN